MLHSRRFLIPLRFMISICDCSLVGKVYAFRCWPSSIEIGICSDLSIGTLASNGAETIGRYIRRVTLCTASYTHVWK